MKFTHTILATAVCGSAVAQDSLKPLTRPDGHAPISIMADHTHGAGEFMFSYRYMFMEMDGMYKGNDSISSASVFANNYVVTPTNMSMEMQMLGMMYAPTDHITLTAMLPYLSSDMDHVINPGAAPLLAANGGSSTFSTSSSGFGDLRLGALIRIIHDSPHHFHVGLGASLPTGSIGESDFIPGPGGLLSRQLPAAMQPGSGTFDLLPSITYSYFAESWSAGVQGSAILRTGRNHHGYRLGNRFDLTSWFGYRLSEWCSISTGLTYVAEGELDGTQSDVLQQVPFGTMPRTVPTAFGENYGGQRLEALAGVNFVIPSGLLRNHRLAADVRIPLWQERNGISLSTDYTVSLGWQYAF
ncbi:MAG: transporter [Akkermansiaceae bacterium]